MNKNVRRIDIWLSLMIILTLFSCVQNAKKNQDDSKEYSYKVLETTGNDKQILVSGKWIDIDYSKNSNPQAIQTLLGLKWEVLNRNYEGKIVLTGKLIDEYRLDIDRKTKIYDFRLDNWSILTPFEYIIQPEGWVPGDTFQIGIKSTLDSNCFRYKVIGNLKQFERYK